MQVQEGHSIGSFGVREAHPQFRNQIELPQRTRFWRVGGSRRFWVEIDPSLRIQRIQKTGTAKQGFFPNVLTTEEGEGE